MGPLTCIYHITTPTSNKDMYISEQPAGIGKDGIKTKRAAKGGVRLIKMEI